MSPEPRLPNNLIINYNSGSAFSISITNIIDMRTLPQMIGIAARRIVAGMEAAHSRLQSATEFFLKREDVRTTVAAAALADKEEEK